MDRSETLGGLLVASLSLFRCADHLLVLEQGSPLSSVRLDAREDEGLVVHERARLHGALYQGLPTGALHQVASRARVLTDRLAPVE
jgi:hypothetical protein